MMRNRYAGVHIEALIGYGNKCYEIMFRKVQLANICTVILKYAGSVIMLYVCILLFLLVNMAHHYKVLLIKFGFLPTA